MVVAFMELVRETKARNFPWAVLNQAVLSLGAIAIIVVLSNVLAAQTFGETRFLTAVLAVFAFFSLPGIGPVMLQRMPMYSRDSFRLALTTQFRWGMGAALGAFIFAVAYYIRGSEDLAIAFFVSGIFAPIANLYLMPGTVFAGLRRFKEKTLLDGFIITSAVIGAAYGATQFGTVAGTMLWYFGAQSLTTAVALYFVTARLPGSTYEPNTNADTRYGKQLTLFQIPFALLPALEKALIFFLLGPVALALYVVALLPIEHVRSAYRSLLQFFSLPHLHPGDADNTRAFVYIAKMAAILTAGAIVVVILFALYVLPFLFPNFTEAQPLIMFSTAVLIALPAEVYILSLLSARRTDFLFSYALITILADILIFVFLVSLFGLYGAVAAKIVTSFLSAGVAFFLYRLNISIIDTYHE